MSSVNETGRRSAGRVVTAVILVIIAVLAIIVGAITWAEPAKSLPSFIPGHIPGSTGRHPLHVIGSFIVAAILLVAAWFALTFTPKNTPSADSRENTPAGQR